MRLLVLIAAFAIGSLFPNAAAAEAADQGPSVQGDAVLELEAGVDVEWLAVRGGGGNGGYYALLSLFTLRWESFYWNIVRGGLLGFSGEFSDTGYFGGHFVLLAGTAIGYPWELDDRGMHELRIGLGVEIGRGNADQWSDTVVIMLYPIVLAPELYYVWNFKKHVSFLVGVDCHYAPIERYWGAETDIMCEGSCLEGLEDRLRAALPAFSTFVGAAF